MNLTLSKKVFLLIIIMFSIQSSFFYYFSEKIIETVLLDETQKQAQIFLHGLEREITSAPNYDTPEFLQKKIDLAIEDFHEGDFSIYRLYIFNQQGDILADSIKNQAKTKKIKAYMQPVFMNGETLISQKIEYKPDLNSPTDSTKMVAITDAIIPMYKNNQVIAAIEIEINMKSTSVAIKDIDDKYENTITQLIVMSGVLFTVFLWLFLKHGILIPIQIIEKTAKAITNGKLNSRVHLNGKDEITHLGQSVNTMATSLQDHLDKQEQAYIQVLQSLTKALEVKDPYTAGHSGRVAKFSVKLGRHLNLAKREITILKQGALMHDLGKIAIPDQILNKPSKLTDEEFEIMRSHPKRTSDILKPLRHYKQHREIAAWHHERWDGNGYPDGLKREEIPLLARIVAIADSWDAMTGDRVYRKGMTREKALSIFIAERDSGQWEPQLIDSFLSMMDKNK